MTFSGQQKELFSGRWRKIRAPEPKELQLHIALAERLRWQVRPGVIWMHIPNGELREDALGAKLKAMGVRPGVADLMFIWRDKAAALDLLFLELKARRGRQTPAQKQFQTDCGVINVRYEIRSDIDSAVELLQQHEILPRPRNKGGDNNEYRGAER
jgi:hypothetical protein